MSDLIKRGDALRALVDTDEIKGYAYVALEERLQEIPAVQPPVKAIGRIEVDMDEIFERVNDVVRRGEWIPCSERLPKDLEAVNITWINHRPATYYADIKDKPFTATAIHYKDKWWWHSSLCEDLLADYGESEYDEMDADIEVVAWMPLPEPWKGATQALPINRGGL